MLTINGIKKGIVIDHITAGLGVQIFKYLKLDRAEYTVALIMNAQSNALGRKDIIKIETGRPIDYGLLGLIDPGVTVNVIENEVIVDKVKLTPPQQVENVLVCRNPRCTTSTESYVPQRFRLVDEGKRLYACEYCDETIRAEDMKEFLKL